MASEDERQLLTQNRRHIILRWPLRRSRATSFGTSTARTKRRKLPSVRLGKRRVGGGSFLVRIFRRIRVRWLRLHYSTLLKKLKAFYSSLLRDLIEAGATMEAIQSRIMMETYFSVPVMPVTVASIPSHVSSPRSRLANTRKRPRLKKEKKKMKEVSTQSSKEIFQRSSIRSSKLKKV